MLNVLFLGTKSAIHRLTEALEVVDCIYASAIEVFFDKQSNETEMRDFQIKERRKCMKYLIDK